MQQVNGKRTDTHVPTMQQATEVCCHGLKDWVERLGICLTSKHEEQDHALIRSNRILTKAAPRAKDGEENLVDEGN